MDAGEKIRLTRNGAAGCTTSVACSCGLASDQGFITNQRRHRPVMLPSLLRPRQPCGQRERKQWHRVRAGCRAGTEGWPGQRGERDRASRSGGQAESIHTVANGCQARLERSCERRSRRVIGDELSPHRNREPQRRTAGMSVSPVTGRRVRRSETESKGRRSCRAKPATPKNIRCDARGISLHRS